MSRPQPVIVEPMTRLLRSFFLGLLATTCLAASAAAQSDDEAQRGAGTPEEQQQAPGDAGRDDDSTASEAEPAPEAEPIDPGRELSKREIKQLEEELPAKYQTWLAEVRLLITKEELQAFLKISQDYQRDHFIKLFWRQRDPYPSTARNEFRERYTRRLDFARAVFGSLADARSEILLLNGEPAGRAEYPRCTNLWPMEAWLYRAAQVGEDTLLLFYQPFGNGDFRLWEPFDGIRALSKFGSGGSAASNDTFSGCGANGDELLRVIRSIGSQGQFNYSLQLQRLREVEQESSNDEWVTSFDAFSTEIPTGTETFPAKLELNYPGRFRSRTVVQGVVTIEREHIRAADFGPAQSYDLLINGEVLQEDRLFDTFRYQYSFPTDEVGEQVPLIFETRLRPGEYSLVVRIEDLHGKKMFRMQRSAEVPAVDKAVPRTSDDPFTERLLAEANEAINTGDNTIEILRPGGSLLTGMVRFATRTTGPDISRVEFKLDETTVLTKRGAPYSVELDLGTSPRMRTLSAIAYDEDDTEVAQDELALNSGPHRFAVQLIEPRSDQTYQNSLRAVAELDIPEGRSVERVEFFFNETKLATVYDAPYEYPIQLPTPGAVGYIRAVAYQPDGNFTEDVVFINTPGFTEDIEVQLVELYVTAVDRNNRPVEGLAEGDFSVSEDGQPQTLMRFDRVTNLPFHAGILLDVSASMAPNLETAQRAALQFFEDSLSPKDRATLLTFNDLPRVAVRFTDSLEELSAGLAGLKAERGTALYDAVIYSLFYFNGIRGQRALIVLSDGEDESSKFDFEKMTDYALRSGVSIYTIRLEAEKTSRQSKRELARLARETGGLAFVIKSAEELRAIYSQLVEELRSRYYLAYQSTNTSREDRFRFVEVEIEQSGVEAKTMSGYYP